jgi:alpha-L-fucosidase
MFQQNRIDGGKISMSGRLFFWFVFLFLAVSGSPIAGQSGSGLVPLADAAQLRWQQKERIMFLCLDPCTWQGREYDNHSIPLTRINPEKLNTDQWCEAARLWGAKEILFVAKHTGGFCWWQTETTNYGIKETPWRNGKGDVLADLSKSCKKYGLDLGIYVYPGDDFWGAGIGSGGITKDPSKQEDYNRVYRQQLTEVLTRYGTIREVWFDGNCNIPVSDILKRYAAHAVIFQGKSATIRWVGNEDGVAPYPNWYTLDHSDLATGVATALQSDPNGNAYGPVEVDAPLLKNKGHKWFWAPNTDSLLMNIDQLMDIYYKSVGRGAVLLLNSTPDTIGLIPSSHLVVYKKFGEEINRRFSVPIRQIRGKGESLVIQFDNPEPVNHVILQEELNKGQRVLEYIVEGFIGGKWKELCKGSSVGNKRIDFFPVLLVEKIRVTFLKYKDTPQIKNFAVYNIPQKLKGEEDGEQSHVIGNWQVETYSGEWKEVNFDLTPFVKDIGQYEIYCSSLARDFNCKGPIGLEFSDCQLEMYGRNASESIVIIENNRLLLTRSQQTLDEFPTILRIKIRSNPCKSAGDIQIKRLIY